MTTLEDLAVSLARLEERVVSVDEKLDASLSVKAEQDKRITSLERTRSYMKGVAATLGAIITLVFGQSVAH
jgi:hypothetical protein